MFDKNELRVIDGWETDFVQDTIRSWKRELSENEADERYEAFVLTIQQEDESRFNVAIEVALKNSVGDLLNANYSEVCSSESEALETGRQFIQEVEDEYDL